MPPIFTCSQFVHLLSFPIVFSLHNIYLSMCVNTGYFSLAFTKLNKLDLSECTITDRYKCTYSPSTHTCSEPDESLILRSPRCVKKQKILLSASIVLVQPCCLGTSCKIAPRLHGPQVSIHSCDLSLSCLQTYNSFDSSSLEHG